MLTLFCVAVTFKIKLMKKIYLFSLLLLSFFTKTSIAQFTCNAQFTTTQINGLTYRFAAVDSLPAAGAQITHSWSIIGGISPNVYNYSTSFVYTFPTPGVYQVGHRISKFGNGTVLCFDTTNSTITIGGSSSCNITPYLQSANTTSPLTKTYVNTSFGVLPSDSLIWNFNDGTAPVLTLQSTGSIQNHTFATAGIYNVCLRVKRININGGICDTSICRIDTVGIVNPPCNIQANFVGANTGLVGTIRTYVNTTLNLLPTDSVRWTFGDGTPALFTLGANPTVTHTYTSPGNYNVCIRVKRNFNASAPPCVSEICKADSIIAPPCNIQANFIKTPLGSSSAVPAIKTYTNTTLNILPADSIRWTITGPNGNIIHTLINLNSFSFTYANAGIYNVCLRVKRNTAAGTPPCISEICRVDTILPPNPNCNVVANFTFAMDSIIAQPNVYVFNNTSTNATQYFWSFGDGTSSILANPTHQFAQPGVYNVCLVAASSLTCRDTLCKTVIVVAPNTCTLNANFVFYRDSTAPNLFRYVFTNTSTGFNANDSIRWSFGDGTFSSATNPIKTYATVGTYNVCLRIIKRNPNGVLIPNCVSEKCFNVIAIVLPPVCNVNASFQYSITPNGAVIFYSPSMPGVTYTWNFGDGSPSQTGATVTHVYGSNGNYNACLTASLPGSTCSQTLCQNVIIAPAQNCASITDSINVTTDSTITNRKRFRLISNATPISQSWRITKISGANWPPVVLNTANPQFLFTDSGTYRICVRAVFANNCIKERCVTVYIANPYVTLPPTATCQLQIYPNPATNVINAAVWVPLATQIKAQIFNSWGMLVAQKIQQGTTGYNIVPVNITQLPAGLYRIKVMYGNSNCTRLFIKQ
jgi:PKD repeat protein